MEKCLNCGTYSGGNYCPECGKAFKIKRLEVKTIFHDITHGILHRENSILKTFKLMLLQPGNTAASYISGQKAKEFFKSLLMLFFTNVSYGLFVLLVLLLYFTVFNE